MYKKSIAMTAVLAASVLSVIAMTTPLAYAGGDASSETETEQELKQKNVGSGESVNSNCAQNLIDSGLGLTTCASISVLSP